MKQWRQPWSAEFNLTNCAFHCCLSCCYRVSTSAEREPQDPDFSEIVFQDRLVCQEVLFGVASSVFARPHIGEPSLCCSLLVVYATRLY